jgi:uncharacterized SAM-binding protein YcdF (DUF218 family)
LHTTRCLLLGIGVALTAVSVASIRALLPTDDVPRDPDAVVVLGGAGAERTKPGIELAERYDAQPVLSSSAALFGEEQGRSCQRDAIRIEPEPESTRGEAREVARLAEKEGWQHVTVATSKFRTSRSRYLFRQRLGERVTVVGAVSENSPSTTRAPLLREGLGVIAGASIQRAC